VILTERYLINILYKFPKSVQFKKKLLADENLNILYLQVNIETNSEMLKNIVHHWKNFRKTWDFFIPNIRKKRKWRRGRHKQVPAYSGNREAS
jgi:hypothetical protein